MSKVAVLKTTPKTVLKDYKKLMHLAKYQKVLSKRFATILKLNLSWTLYFPACSTEPWQLDGVLETMVSDNYKKIIPVENKTVVTNPWKGAKLNKWLPILEKYNLKFVSLPEVKWIKYKPKSELLAMYDIFPKGFRIPEMFVGKNVLHLPTIKTHGHTIMTGAIKNSFGGLITERRHHCHKKIHEILVDLLTLQKEIHKGIFAITDGTVAGDGGGPRTMVPKIKNYILASEDQVAIDAVSAKMMGFDPLSIPFIKISHDKGLGCGDVSQIDIIGSDIRRENWKFKVKKSPIIFFDRLLRLSPLEPLLFHTGIFKLFIVASAVYHDWIWYKIRGRSIIEQFSSTKWGRLFQTYK